jgi:hypothetical protein
MEKYDLLPRAIRALFWAAIAIVSLFAMVVVLLLANPVSRPGRSGTSPADFVVPAIQN